MALVIICGLRAVKVRQTLNADGGSSEYYVATEGITGKTARAVIQGISLCLLSAAGRQGF